MINVLLILISCVFLSASLGQFQGISLGSSRIYLFEVLTLGYSFISLVYLLATKKDLLIKRNMILLLGFLVFCIISLIFNLNFFTFNQILVSSFYLLRFLNFCFLFFVTYQVAKDSDEFRKKILYTLLFSCLVVSVGGLIQLKVFPNLSDLPPELGWDPHINRLASTFFDPNFVGGYLVLGLVTSLCLLYENKKNYFLYLLTFIFTICLVLTFSRSSWLAFSFVVLVFGILKSRKLLFLTLVLMFLTYYLVPRAQTRLSGVTDPNDSAKYRLISWSNALTIAKDNLIFGTGFNTYRFAQERYGFFDYRDPTGGHAGSGADSSLLLVLATTGIPGFILFSLFIFDNLISSLKNYLNEKRTIPLIIFISLVAVMVHSQFVNSFFYPQFLLWVFTLLALG